MNRTVLTLLLALALAAPLAAQQPAHNYRHRSTHTAIGPIARDHQGRILRSEAAKHRFEAASGHPHGWAGHVVDHVVPLACGGADAPSNMQWQTVAAGKAKDKTERIGCATRNPMGH
jgi:hypothetical protein